MATGVSGGQRPPVDLALEHAGEGVGDRGPGEERAAGEHLVQHHTEGPDVGPLVDRGAACLLGSHVRRGTQDHSELGAVHRGEGRRIQDRGRAREIGGR